jgi:hypothetical protein
MTKRRTVSVILASLVLTSCITNNVKKIDRQEIAEICIRENPEVLMDGFLPNLIEEIERKGIRARVYQDSAPADCSYTMIYTANWNWDMAMYLSYAHIVLYREGTKIGEATFDARLAGLDLSKFASAESKIDPLIAELLQNAE